MINDKKGFIKRSTYVLFWSIISIFNITAISKASSIKHNYKNRISDVMHISST